MRILGVDPGSLRTGWGLLIGTAGRPRLLECGVIQLGPNSSLPTRLHSLRVEFEALVQRLHPTSAAVEAPFHGPNARSAFHLTHARGVLLAVLGGEGIPVAEYTPATVKKAVTGNGRAEKGQVQGMVGRLLGSGSQPFDAADALGVAFCHASSLGYRSAVGRAPERRH